MLNFGGGGGGGNKYNCVQSGHEILDSVRLETNNKSTITDFVYVATNFMQYLIGLIQHE